MGGILPQGKTQYLSDTGAPLAGGSVYCYAQGTTSYKDTWKDSSYSTKNTNPVILDASGSAVIWGAGAYTIVVKNAGGVQISSTDVVAPPAAGAAALANWAALDALHGVGVGDTYVLDSGQLGSPETVKIVAAGTYAADGVLVRNLTASGLQAVSTRQEYASFTEFDADPRGLTSGQYTIPSIGSSGTYVTTGQNLTTTAKTKVYVNPLWIGAAGGIFNPVHFGAIPDWNGSTGTDSATAFSACVAATLAKSSAMMVPVGRFYVSSTISVQGNAVDRFTMIGVGRSSELATDQAIDILDIKGTYTDTFQYPWIKGVSFVQTNASGNCVRTRWTEFLKIENCVFSGGSKNLVMSENATESDIKPSISSNLFSSGAYGIYGGQTRVADAKIENNLLIDLTTTYIYMGYLDGGTIKNNKMFSNNGAANAANGLQMLKPIYAEVSGNSFFNLGGSAILLTSPRESKIHHNFLASIGLNANQTAIAVTDYSSTTAGYDVQITSNTLETCNGYGITVLSANTQQSDYTISENYFTGIGGASYDAISLQKTTNFKIKGNIIRGGGITRYWLSANADTGLELNDNDHNGCVNSDIYRINSPTGSIKNPTVALFGVTATTSIELDRAGLSGGALTSSITINLPTASFSPGLQMVFLKTDASAYSLILTAAGTQKINGAATKNVSTQYQVVRLISDGSNWVAA